MLEKPQPATDIESMEQKREFIMAVLGWIGLMAGGLLGYPTAGVLGVIAFAPLGALAGLILGLMGLRALYFMEIVS